MPRRSPSLFPKPPRKPASREHGDWRVPLEHPEEVEHYYNPSLSTWRRLYLQAEYLQQADTRQWLRAAEEEGYGESPERWRRVLHRVIAYALLLPLSVVMVFALLVQLYHDAPMLSERSFWLSEPVWFSVMGALLWVILRASLLMEGLLVYVYVLGHELTHALSALLCGGRLHGMRVGMNGGYLETDADNWFIALSPYFVPLWMLCWLGVLWVVNAVLPFEAYAPWFYAGFGFWWAFHLYWTVWIIPREQPDMLSYGLFLSMLVILLANIAVLLVVLRCFGALSLRGYWADFCTCAQEIGAMLADVGLWLWQLGLALL